MQKEQRSTAKLVSGEPQRVARLASDLKLRLKTAALPAAGVRQRWRRHQQAQQ